MSTRSKAMRAAVALSGGLAVVLASPLAALAGSGPTGRLSFSGYWSAHAAVRASVGGTPGCMWGTKLDAYNGRAGVELYLGDVAVTIAGRHDTLDKLALYLSMPKLGASTPVNDSDQAATAAGLGVEYQTGSGPSGQTVDAAIGVSGTVTTSANGSSGSLHAVADAEVKFSPVASKAITITASWSGCPKVTSGTA